MSVTLQPVTIENWRALIRLDVHEEQSSFVASNLYSIAESQFGFGGFEDEGHWGYHPFGAYVADEPIGFAMYCFNHNHPRFQGFVMRLMVDKNHQGKGYGREIMEQVLDKFRADEKIENIGISYEPHNETARKLYANLGFVETGEIIEGEALAVLNLR